EGGHSKSHSRLRSMMYREPALFDELLGQLADVVADHLNYQIASGADAVVLFDTWAGTLSRQDYIERVLPFSQRALAPVLGKAPLMAFVLNGGHVLDQVVDLGVDGVVIDWRVSLADAMERFGDRVAIQGNLDPALLLAPPEVVAERTRALLEEAGGRPGHILALGHGVIKETDPESVAAFVKTARAAVTTGSR
ncbi:MAG: uroporphyrinogen decarboxylase, partial [Pseudohongiellaceae bacterium]